MWYKLPFLGGLKSLLRPCLDQNLLQVQLVKLLEAIEPLKWTSHWSIFQFYLEKHPLDTAFLSFFL